MQKTEVIDVLGIVDFLLESKLSLGLKVTFLKRHYRPRQIMLALCLASASSDEVSTGLAVIIENGTPELLKICRLLVVDFLAAAVEEAGLRLEDSLRISSFEQTENQETVVHNAIICVSDPAYKLISALRLGLEGESTGVESIQQLESCFNRDEFFHPLADGLNEWSQASSLVRLILQDDNCEFLQQIRAYLLDKFEVKDWRVLARRIKVDDSSLMLAVSYLVDRG